jgi:hypothetical protein
MAVSLKRASAKKKKKKQTRWGRAGRPHPTAVLAIEALVLVPLDLRRTVMKRLNTPAYKLHWLIRKGSYNPRRYRAEL